MAKRLLSEDEVVRELQEYLGVQHVMLELVSEAFDHFDRLVELADSKDEEEKQRIEKRLSQILELLKMGSIRTEETVRKLGC